MKKISSDRLKYLTLLAENYKNIDQASTEAINLQAILNLPKGTEHFISDIHGEFESFHHVLKNASGVIKNYIVEIFGTSLMENEKRNLATLVYYPARKLESIKKLGQDTGDWYKINLFRLIQILKRVSSKYTRSKVRKALPHEFSYIIEELVHEESDRIHKEAYYHEIINTIIQLDRADDFIIAISNVIQRLAIDHLHVLGDIYDRGQNAFMVMEALCDYHSVDIQWGNHDISWMGAASGCGPLIFNVIRICSKYNNLDTLEEDYGVNLLPLAMFAMETYAHSSVKRFMPDKHSSAGVSENENIICARIQKAVAVIQFKLEAEIIKRHPEFLMDSRNLFDKVDYQNKKITINGKTYDMLDCDFPTIDPNDPFALSEDEKRVVTKIKRSFRNSRKLQEHTKFLFSKGSMYKTYNSNLLFHGCIPMDDNGFKTTNFMKDKPLAGKELLDGIEKAIRRGFLAKTGSKDSEYGLDLLWYLWCGPDSPLFGKDQMTTFERYFIEDKATHEEIKDKYFDLRNKKEICSMILESFQLDSERSRIINGHVPVKVSKGESPVKAEGKLINIDGGFAKAYQSVTGIAGYTLIFNSQGLFLASHEPFVSAEEAIEKEIDMLTSTQYIERYPNRVKVNDTDIGQILKVRISDLCDLLDCYRKGLIIEKI